MPPIRTHEGPKSLERTDLQTPSSPGARSVILSTQDVSVPSRSADTPGRILISPISRSESGVSITPVIWPAPRQNDVPVNRESLARGFTRGFPAAKPPVKAYGPYRLPQPAVWADLGEPLASGPARENAIQREAETLAEALGASQFPAESVDYRAQWDLAVATSDQLFRARYGGTAWMAHHVQAHHLAAARQLSPP